MRSRQQITHITRASVMHKPNRDVKVSQSVAAIQTATKQNGPKKNGPTKKEESLLLNEAI